MTANVTKRNRDLRQSLKRSLPFVVALVAVATLLPSASSANDAQRQLQLMGAYDKFEGTRLVGFVQELRSPRLLRASSLDLTYGAITTSSESAAFVSLGPVWQLRLPSERWFLHLGFSPTVISGSTFAGKDVGGHVHFTSSATLGTSFGKRRPLSLSLRIQHTSNGGLNRVNPGLDMIGVSFGLDISD